MGGRRRQIAFDADSALRVARGYHASAGYLENAASQLQNQAQSAGDMVNQTPPTHVTVATTQLVIAGKVVIGIPTHLMWDHLGYATSAVVLEALALEIALKARLKHAGQDVPDEHDHSKLFSQLPQNERTDIQSRYQGRRLNGLMADTIEDVFSESGKTLTNWRYVYERSEGVTARVGAMRYAFEALVDSL